MSSSIADTAEVAPAPTSSRRLLNALRVSAKSRAMLGGFSVENTCGATAAPANFSVTSTLPPGRAVYEMSSSTPSACTAVPNTKANKAIKYTMDYLNTFIAKNSSGGFSSTTA